MEKIKAVYETLKVIAAFTKIVWDILACLVLGVFETLLRAILTHLNKSALADEIFGKESLENYDRYM